jgi:L-ascorbate metabolism protein UlaG (beta-lactamase superfamily)
MIIPALKDEAFLEDVRSARSDFENFHLWWVGQSGYLLEWQGNFVLLDPYLSDSLTTKYAVTDKPHVRMTERVVAPGKLDFIKIVTSSHNHTDHLDAETLIPVLNANPKVEIIIPEANREFVAVRLGISTDLPIGLDAGKSVTVQAFTFHGVPAAHETIDKDQDGRCKYLGYVIEFNGWTIYHSGDTIRYDGMGESLKKWNIDLALLPINGSLPERRVAGNMNGPEAASLASEIGARFVIPCHYDMFEFNTVPPDLFVRAAVELRQPFQVLQAGERWSSQSLPPRG